MVVMVCNFGDSFMISECPCFPDVLSDNVSLLYLSVHNAVTAERKQLSRVDGNCNLSTWSRQQLPATNLSLGVSQQ